MVIVDVLCSQIHPLRVRAMKKLITSLLFLIFLAIPAYSQKDWLRDSDLVFEGEVLKLHTSTIDANDPSDLGLVRVTDIIEGESVLRDYLQKPITVKFRKIEDVKPGQKAIFFARLWLSGRGIAVREIGMKRLNNDAGSQDLKQKQEIRKDRIEIQDEQLREEIKQAEHVIAGRVISLKRLPVQTTKESEHDPVLTEAEIEVVEQIKGSFARGKIVKITFAASNDIMWVRSPKFARGETRLLLLKKNPEEFREVPNFVIIDRRQVLDINRSNEVKRLM